MNVAFNKNDGLLGRSGQAFSKESAKHKSKVALTHYYLDINLFFDFNNTKDIK
ncbi:hypothetical protein CAV_0588 [Campylobacter avium LMG 24591]|uniref:Uncharacterized protein n=1 Tax=Campylobacter avium LMG 24591 TaxID=522484 RepID=A0A222MWI1_9BACT|nr:hypothetical protein [Campylobacter avium]ASQ30255.1 hypothetical protein CAV_0588 [Campylobacter avium LMG 24591]OYD79353.1 hypothetical protein CAV8706_0590 [Campylobacter avium]